MKKTNFILYTFILLFLGCNEPKFETKDFIGVWKADDGASIVINQDGTCKLNDLNNTIINISQKEIKKINAQGTWKKIDDVNSGITGSISTGIEFSYTLMNRKGGTLFYISGQGFNESKPPWNLFVWSGDPDDNIKYEFTKQ